MYHLELRQFPHNLNRFNLSEGELRAILTPWAREQPLELGERKWSPHQAKLTVLEGPRLEVQQLSMGRGWRAAERQSDDVTERVLAETSASGAATGASPSGAFASSAPAPGAPADAPPMADPLALGVELAALLGGDPAGLLAAWRRAAADSPGLSPSESLTLAEQLLAATRADPA
jgi:hypothetical protein